MRTKPGDLTALSTVDRMAAGALAGTLATVPMTLTMNVLHSCLPSAQRYPLPPREITEKVGDEVAEAIDAAAPSEETVQKATLIGHYGYGAAMGALYGLLPEAGPPVARGAVWALTVWTVSYLGWLPAAHILRPATEHPARRNALMIASHLVWGTTTALLMEAARRQRENSQETG